MKKPSILKRTLFVLLAAAVLISGSACRKSEFNEEYEKRLQALNDEKQALIDERYLLGNKIYDELGNMSYMSFVFIGLDSGLYNDVFPIFDSGDIKLTGVMAFSEDELPGMDGKISMLQYGELIERGWGISLYWEGATSDTVDGSETDIAADNSDELALFLQNMQSALSALGIEFPGSIVFEDGAYEPEYDSLLYEYGIDTVMHDGDNEYGIVASDKPEGVWHAGIIGWRDLLRSTRLKNLIETGGGYAAFKISFENTEDNYSTSFYPIEGENTSNGVRTDVFERMITRFKSSVGYGSIHIYGISESREKVVDYYETELIYGEEIDSRTEEIDALIKDVDRRISELYGEYY